MKDESEAQEHGDFKLADFKLDHIFSEEVTGTWKDEYVALNKEDYNKLLPKKKIDPKVLKILQKLSKGADTASIAIGESYDPESQETRTFNKINYAYEGVLTKLSEIRKLVKEVEKTHEV